MDYTTLKETANNVPYVGFPRWAHRHFPYVSDRRWGFLGVHK